MPNARLGMSSSPRSGRRWLHTVATLPCGEAHVAHKEVFVEISVVDQDRCRCGCWDGECVDTWCRDRKIARLPSQPTGKRAMINTIINVWSEV